MIQAIQVLRFHLLELEKVCFTNGRSARDAIILQTRAVNVGSDIEDKLWYFNDHSVVQVMHWVCCVCVSMITFEQNDLWRTHLV